MLPGDAVIDITRVICSVSFVLINSKKVNLSNCSGQRQGPL